MADIRALTVRQPWAWAIAHGGKNIENRSRLTNFRGRLLIHAGAGWSLRGQSDPRIRALPIDLRDPGHTRAAIVAVADLLDVHPSDGTCCEPWGEHTYDNASGRRVDEVWHYVLDNVRALDDPIQCRGRLGLWKPPTEVADLVLAQLAPTGPDELGRRIRTLEAERLRPVPDPPIPVEPVNRLERLERHLAHVGAEYHDLPHPTDHPEEDES